MNDQPEQPSSAKWPPLTKVIDGTAWNARTLHQLVIELASDLDAEDVTLSRLQRERLDRIEWFARVLARTTSITRHHARDVAA